MQEGLRLSFRPYLLLPSVSLRLVPFCVVSAGAQANKSSAREAPHKWGNLDPQTVQGFYLVRAGSADFRVWFFHSWGRESAGVGHGSTKFGLRSTKLGVKPRCPRRPRPNLGQPHP